MKKIILGLLLAGSMLALFSCKKDSNPYYVKIKKDGNWTNYPQVAGELGPDLLDPSLTDLGIRGQTTDGKEVFDIAVQVPSTTFNTGTYRSDQYPQCQVIFDIIQQDGTSLRDFRIEDATGLPPSLYSVTITEITDQTLRGTFTGNYLVDALSDQVMNLTEGEFYVKRLR